MTTPATPESASSSSELISGFLAVLSIVGSALGLVYQPVKVLPFAFLIALIATGMAPRDSKLPAGRDLRRGHLLRRRLDDCRDDEPRALLSPL